MSYICIINNKNKNCKIMQYPEIVKHNKKIALFMGGRTKGMTLHKVASNEIWLPVHGICRMDTAEPGRGKYLRYHASWDWLVPVVATIRSRPTYSAYSQIHGPVEVHPNDKMRTYLSVVNFIDWRMQIA